MTDSRTHTEQIRAAIQRGYHTGGHHPRCAIALGKDCDCYARSTAEAIDALDAVEAQLEALKAERAVAIDWAAELAQKHQAADVRVKVLGNAWNELAEHVMFTPCETCGIPSPERVACGCEACKVTADILVRGRAALVGLPEAEQ